MTKHYAVIESDKSLSTVQNLSDTMKECRAAVLYDMKEIEILKHNLRNESSEKEKKLLKMQKDVEKCLRKLARENIKIKNQLEAERRKNKRSINKKLDKQTQFTNDTINESELENTNFNLETTNDDILSGLRTTVENLKNEDETTQYDSNAEHVCNNSDISNSEVAFENCSGEVSFDFLDCTINNKDKLTSTRISIDKKRRESRRQTIFDLLQENTTYKKQLRMERRKSMHNKKDVSLLGDKINKISLGEYHSDNESCKKTSLDFIRYSQYFDIKCPIELYKLRILLGTIHKGNQAKVDEISNETNDKERW